MGVKGYCGLKTDRNRSTGETVLPPGCRKQGCWKKTAKDDMQFVSLRKRPSFA